MHRALLVVALLAGCSLPVDDSEHCGEVRRRADGAWFLPTVRANQPLPAQEVFVESAVWRAWDSTYETSACGHAVQLGEASPWSGPVLHVGERDAIDVLVANHTDANVVGGRWRIELFASGPLAVVPDAWEGDVHETAHVAFVVEATGEGRGHVRVNATFPSGYEQAVRVYEYVVRDGVEGSPHRVALQRTL